MPLTGAPLVNVSRSPSSRRRGGSNPAPVVPGVDSTPNAFTFTDVTNATVNTVYESNAITVSGTDAPATMSIVGGQYSVNGGAYASTAVTVFSGDTVKVRATSSGSASTATNVTLTIGGVSDTYTVTTGVGVDTTPDAFTFTDVTGATPSTIYESNTITVGGINTPANMTISGGEYSVNGGAYASSNRTVSNGDTIKVRGTSSGSDGTVVNVSLTIGGVSDVYSIRTADAFSFTPFAYYDASSIVAEVGAAAQWTDLGPNGIHLVPATAANRPAAWEASGGFDRTAYPDLATTGVRTGVTLTVVSDTTISTPGALVTGLEVHGTLMITANNVTVRDCKIMDAGFFGIRVPAEYTGAVIEYCDVLDGVNGIAAQGTIRYNNIENTENGIFVYGPSLIEHNYIHDLAGDADAHFDGIQMSAGTDTTIRHNTIINANAQTSTIALFEELGPISNIVIDGNYLTGGGFTIYSPDEVTIVNNVLGKGLFGFLDTTGVPTWSNNIDVATWRYVGYDNGLAGAAPASTMRPVLLFDGIDDVLVSSPVNLSSKTALCAFASVKLGTFGDLGLLVVGPTGLSDNDASGVLLFYPYATDTIGTFRGGSFNLAAAGNTPLQLGVTYNIPGDSVTIYNHTANTSVASAALTNGPLTNAGCFVLGARWISGAPASSKYAAFEIDALILTDFVPSAPQLGEIWAWLAPTDFSFTPLAYYDETSVVQAAGAVSQWTDKGPNGIHLVQATGAAQPTWNAGASRLEFDGTSDYLISSAKDLSTKPALCAFARLTNLKSSGGILVTASDVGQDYSGDGAIIWYASAVDVLSMFRDAGINIVVTQGVNTRVGAVFNRAGNEVIYNRETPASSTLALSDAAFSSAGRFVLGGRSNTTSGRPGEFGNFTVSRLLLLDFVPTTPQLDEIWAWLA